MTSSNLPQLNILQEAQENILRMPENQRSVYANVLNYSLYLDPNEPLASFSPHQIAVRWNVSTKGIARILLCVTRAEISRALELIGIENLSMHQVRRYFSNATYRDKFPGRLASSAKPNDPKARLIFTYAEVFHLAAHADLIGYTFDVLLPDGLADLVDGDALHADVNDRQAIKDLLRSSKYPNDG